MKIKNVENTKVI